MMGLWALVAIAAAASGLLTTAYGAPTGPSSLSDALASPVDPNATAPRAIVCPGSQFATTQVTHWSLDFDIDDGVYDWSRAANKCNGRVRERIVYDLSTIRANKDFQERKFSLDFMDSFELINVTCKSGIAIVTDFEKELDLGHTGTNGAKKGNSVTVRWTFRILGDSGDTSLSKAVDFDLEYETQGMLRYNSTTDKNFFQWLPFLGTFKEEGTFLEDLNVAIHLPWGKNQRAIAKDPNSIPVGKGFNLGVNQLNIVESWDDTNMTVTFKKECYNSIYSADYFIDFSFDKQATACDKLPTWMFYFLGGVCSVVLLLVCSFFGFVYFEQPFRTFIDKEEALITLYKIPKSELSQTSHQLTYTKYSHIERSMLIQQELVRPPPPTLAPVEQLADGGVSGALSGGTSGALSVGSSGHTAGTGSAMLSQSQHTRATTEDGGAADAASEHTTTDEDF